MSYKNPAWATSVIDAYKSMTSVKGWKKCKGCGEFPRLWIFDNGRFAKCCCSGKYEGGEARAESIISYIKRNDMSCADYPQDALRIAWNRYVETGERQTELPEGQH